MTKAELVESVAKELEKERAVVKAGVEIPRAAIERIVDFIGNSILTELVIDGRSALPGLGFFTLVQREAREHRIPTGPNVGEKVMKPAHKVIKFKATKAVNERVNP